MPTPHPVATPGAALPTVVHAPGKGATAAQQTAWSKTSQQALNAPVAAPQGNPIQEQKLALLKNLLAGTPLAGLNLVPRTQATGTTNATGGTNYKATGTGANPALPFGGQWPTQQNNLYINGTKATPTQGTTTYGSGQSSGQPQQQPQQPLNSAQTTAQNMYLQALQAGDAKTIAQIQRNFGLSGTVPTNAQIQALRAAGNAGQYVLDPQVYGRILSSANQPTTSVTGQVVGNSSSGQPIYTAPQYAVNGFNQYSPNLDTNLTLPPALQQELHGIMQSGMVAQSQQQAQLLGKDSPYYVALNDPLTYNSRIAPGAYNAAGQATDILPFGSQYQTALRNAQLSGKVLSPQLAAALQAQDAYANNNMAINAAGGLGMYGPTGPASSGTNFGGGDGGAGYDYGPVTSGTISAITPTQQSLAPGGLFGDTIKGGAGNYIGSPTTPVITNTGVPYQDGVTVHPGVVQITPPGGAQYLPSPNYPNGIPSSTVQLPLGYGNAAGNTPVWSPETGYIVPLPTQYAQGAIVGQPQGANLTTISNPTTDVFSQQSAPTPYASTYAQAAAQPYAGYTQYANAVIPDTNQNYADGMMAGIMDALARSKAGAGAGLKAALSGLY